MATHAMKRFDKDNYIKEAYDYDNNKYGNMRSGERGFSTFFAETLDQIDNLTSTKLSVLEIGIGGGGTFVGYIENLKDSVVYGIDHFDKDGREFYNASHTHNYIRDNFDELLIDFEKGEAMIHRINKEQADRGNDVKLWYATDAYTQEAADKVYEFNKGAIDFIYDDGAPRGTDTLLHMWKDKVSNNGMLITTTVFGNGCQEAYDRLYSENNILQELSDNIAKEGWIVFEMNDYKVLSDPPSRRILEGFNCTYMCIYAKNYNLFEDILTKHEHNIIAGKENWKHD